MKIGSFNLEFSGMYELTVLNKNGKVVKHQKIKNLITDGGLDLYFTATGGSLDDYCHVGTGTTPAAVTDTSLQNRIAFRYHTAVNYENLSLDPNWYWSDRTYQFDIGAVVGLVSEVGVNMVTTNSALFSRAVLPIPIEVLAEEQLIVTYKLYIKVPDIDQAYTISDGTTNYDVTVRPSYFHINNIINWRNILQGIRGFQSPTQWTAYARESDVFIPISDTQGVYFGSINQSEPASLSTYVTGSFTRTYSVKFLATKANYPTGIGTMTAVLNMGTGLWQFRFSPKLPKDSTKVLTVNYVVSATRGTPP